jgi:hypothetical protein
MRMVLKPKTPEVYFRITGDCGFTDEGDWLFAWPSCGQVQILTDAEVRQRFDVTDGSQAHRWTPERRARGARAFVYCENKGATHPISSTDVTTLVALDRAGPWSTTAQVNQERVNLVDSSLDGCAASLGDLVRAGLVDKRQNPQHRLRSYLWAVRPAARAIIDEYGEQALQEAAVKKLNGAEVHP